MSTQGPPEPLARPEGNPAPSQIQPPPPTGTPAPWQQPQPTQQVQPTQNATPAQYPAAPGHYVAAIQYPPQGTYTPPPAAYVAPAQYGPAATQYAPAAPQHPTSPQYAQPTPPHGLGQPSNTQQVPPAQYFPPTTKAKRPVGKLIAIILLSVALTVALAFIVVGVLQLTMANAQISDQKREIRDQKELIEKKETFGAAMNNLMDTAKRFDGGLMADLIPVNDYEAIARSAWNHRWDGSSIDQSTESAIAATRHLETLLSDAETESATNTTGSTYEAVIDQLGGGFVSSVIEDADALCLSNVLACVISDNPYVVHFDAASNANEYMNEWLRTGIAYHEFAHVLQFTNPEKSEVAAAAFDGDHETMADCFALTYLDGWTLDHTIWLNSREYWEISIGYGYTCNDSQRQTVKDWYEQIGYTTSPISQ